MNKKTGQSEGGGGASVHGAARNLCKITRNGQFSAQMIASLTTHDAHKPLINNHLNDSSARQPPGTASASIPRATVRAPKRPEGFDVTDLTRRRRGRK